MKKILVIDDDAAIGWLLSRLLSSEYAVTYAPSVLTALSFVREDEFDLVLTDLVMPGRNGFEGMAMIREIAPTLKIVLMTGSRTEADRAWILSCGADDFIPKPFDIGQLRSVIRRQLGPHAICCSRETADTK